MGQFGHSQPSPLGELSWSFPLRGLFEDDFLTEPTVLYRIARLHLGSQKPKRLGRSSTTQIPNPVFPWHHRGHINRRV